MNNRVCRICQREVPKKQFGNHLKTHNIAFIDYVKTYTEDFQYYGRECSNPNCKKPIWESRTTKYPTCNHTCFGQWQSLTRSGKNSTHFGKPKSEETKKKLRKKAKERYSDPTNHPRYGVTMSEETKKKIGQKAKERLSDPTNHPLYGKLHSKQTREKISKTRIERGVAKGENNPMFGKTHTPEAIEKIFKKRIMYSTEKGIAEILDELNTQYTFQFFLSREGVCRSYDFKIKDKNILIEIDGDYWHLGPGCKEHHPTAQKHFENDKFKDQFAREHGYQVVRFWGSELKGNRSAVKQRIEEILSMPTL